MTVAEIRLEEPTTITIPKHAGKTGSRARLHYLDWMRGVAAVIMIQGHTFDAFTAAEHRSGAAFMLSQFFGGLAPAIFLFLTGITFALGMDRRERQALSPWGRIVAALHRSRYLFLLAFLFRIQMWVFGLPGSRWQDLFKVDILNCMGMTMLLLSALAVASPAWRFRLAACAGIGIAALSPLASEVNWSWAPAFVAAYFVPSYSLFAVFPWASFLAFGVAAGSLIRLVRHEQMNRVMQWAAILGFGLVLAGQYFASLPYSIYSKSEFWLNSPAQVISKLGVVLLLAALAFLWMEYGVGRRWSWVRQLGTTSLLVYWVHIELVYGRWLGAWRQNLRPEECAVFTLVLLAAMVGLSVVKTKLAEHRQVRLWRDVAAV